MALNDPRISKSIDVQHYLKKNEIDFERLFQLENSFSILKKFIDYYACQNNLEFYSYSSKNSEIQEYCDERYSYQQRRNEKLKIRTENTLENLIGFTSVEKLRNFANSNQTIDEFLQKNKDTLKGSVCTWPTGSTDSSCKTGRYSYAYGGENYYTFWMRCK